MSSAHIHIYKLQFWLVNQAEIYESNIFLNDYQKPETSVN